MYRILHGLLSLYVLRIVIAGRDGVDDFQGSASKLHRDRLLQVQNGVLKEEVSKLRAELRVAASGALVRVKEHQHTNRSDGHGLVEAAQHTNRSDGHGLVEEMHAVQPNNASNVPVDAGPLLSVDLQDISEAIARDAAAAARTKDTRSDHTATRINETNHSKAGPRERKVLFVIFSSAKFYDTRVVWMLDMWAKKLPSSQLVIIGDGDASAHLQDRVNIHRTRCNVHEDHSMGIACKYAEAIVVAQTMMWNQPELEWVYLADDDSYIRGAQLEQALLNQRPSHPLDRGVVLANFGCVAGNCLDLLCGGPGYGANRWAIELMAGDPAGFVQEMMQNSQGCAVDNSKGPWGDGGLAEVINDRGIERRTLDGVYGWMMDKSCLEYSLESEKEPLLYHMIRSRPQMEFLQRLFSSVEEQTGSSVPPGSNTALEGLGGCVEFHGNVQCAASRADEDRPWQKGPAKCTKPRMPRLPVLLGVFTLVLLFAILITFIWAGIRYQQWEGWKLQGIKWHSHSMQGRSRFR